MKKNKKKPLKITKKNIKKYERKLVKLNEGIWSLRDKHTRISVALLDHMRLHKIRKVGEHAKIESTRVEWDIEGLRELIKKKKVKKRAKQEGIKLSRVIQTSESVDRARVEELLKAGVFKKKQVARIIHTHEQTPFLRRSSRNTS